MCFFPTGTIDFDIVRRCSKYYSQIENTVLEPLRTIRTYQTFVNDNPINGVTWNWHQKTWANFKAASKMPSKKFHFISAISVLYYMTNWQKDLLDMYHCLEDYGILMITIATGELTLFFNRYLYSQ